MRKQLLVSEFSQNPFFLYYYLIIRKHFQTTSQIEEGH